MMKGPIQRLGLLTLISAASAASQADLVETTESAAPTTYCVPQTQVRGSYENLVIDHNLVIPPADHFKMGDIFVGARLKSQPNQLWLLSGITWKQINSSADLRHAHYQNFPELPLVAPVFIFYHPTDITDMVGDLEIWVGYGLRSMTESAEDSFNEMVLSQRYKLIWRSLPPPTRPVQGIANSFDEVCLQTTTVNQVIKTVGLPIGGVTTEPDLSGQ